MTASKEKNNRRNIETSLLAPLEFYSWFHASMFIKKNWEILETDDDDEFKKLEFESKKLELEI